MSGAELRACLAAIGWSIRTLAERASVRQTTAQRWAMDQQRIPPLIAAWLTKLAQYHAKHPAPTAD